MPSTSEAAVAGAHNALHGRAEFDRRQRLRQRVGERLHPAAERETGRHILGHLLVLLSRAGADDLALDQAAVRLLQCQQPRKRGAHRNPPGVAGIDPSDEGVDCVVEELGAQSAAHEGRDRFVDADRCAGNERLREQPQLGVKREGARGEERARRARQRDQFSTPDDVARRRHGIGVDAFVRDTQVRKQRVDERRRVECAVRPHFIEEAVSAAAGDHASGLGSGIQDRATAGPLGQAIGRGQSGDAGADHDGVYEFHLLLRLLHLVAFKHVAASKWRLPARVPPAASRFDRPIGRAPAAAHPAARVPAAPNAGIRTTAAPDFH